MEDTDELLMVSDGGQIIRMPVDGVRITSRGAQGVTAFNTSAGETVVSVERLGEADEPTVEDGDESSEGGDEGKGAPDNGDV